MLSNTITKTRNQIHTRKLLLVSQLIRIQTLKFCYLKRYLIFFFIVHPFVQVGISSIYLRTQQKSLLSLSSLSSIILMNGCMIIDVLPFERTTSMCLLSVSIDPTPYLLFKPECLPSFV